jgi:purine-binding chemotaxis protein CheW
MSPSLTPTRSSSLASTASIPEATLAPTLLFRVGGATYGCDIEATQEIIPLRRMTRVPGAPAYVRGLINMRGTIVTVLDLGMRLDPSSVPIAGGEGGGSILLLRHRDRLVGIVVEEVLDMRGLEIDEGDAGQRGGAGTIVRGMATLDDATVVVLDLDALIKQVLLS